MRLPLDQFDPQWDEASMSLRGPITYLVLCSAMACSSTPVRSGCTKDTDCAPGRICGADGQCAASTTPPGGGADAVDASASETSTDGGASKCPLPALPPTPTTCLLSGSYQVHEESTCPSTCATTAAASSYLVSASGQGDPILTFTTASDALGFKCNLVEKCACTTPTGARYVFSATGFVGHSTKEIDGCNTQRLETGVHD